MRGKLGSKDMAAPTAGSRHTDSVWIYVIEMGVLGIHRSRHQTLGPLLHCHRKTRASTSLLASGNSRHATSVSLLSSKCDIHMSAWAEAGPHVEPEEVWEMEASLSIFQPVTKGRQGHCVSHG